MTQRTEVPIKGTITLDKKLGLISVDIETDDGEFGCLSWSFDLDKHDDVGFCNDLIDMLTPPPLDDPHADQLGRSDG
jgi:hypothetical protein